MIKYDLIFQEPMNMAPNGFKLFKNMPSADLEAIHSFLEDNKHALSVDLKTKYETENGKRKIIMIMGLCCIKLSLKDYSTI